MLNTSCVYNPIITSNTETTSSVKNKSLTFLSCNMDSTKNEKERGEWGQVDSPLSIKDRGDKETHGKVIPKYHNRFQNILVNRHVSRN
jgi:hypothetical protein